MRTLTINNTDISTLGATLLTVDYGYSKVVTYKDWLRGAMNPIFYEQDTKYTTAEYKILVEAMNRDALDLASSNLTALASKGVFQVSDATFYIDGNLVEATDNLINSKAKEIVIKVEGIKCQADYMSKVIPIADVLSITPVGNVEVAARFEITPNVSMPNYTLTVNGTSYTITDTSTPAGSDGVYKCVIDGILGKVEVGGNNAIERYQAFDFPTLKGGKENTLEFSSGGDVKISYNGRWM